MRCAQPLQLSRAPCCSSEGNSTDSDQHEYFLPQNCLDIICAVFKNLITAGHFAVAVPHRSGSLVVTEKETGWIDCVNECIISPYIRLKSLK